MRQKPGLSSLISTFPFYDLWTMMTYDSSLPHDRLFLSTLCLSLRHIRSKANFQNAKKQHDDTNRHTALHGNDRFVCPRGEHKSTGKFTPRLVFAQRVSGSNRKRLSKPFVPNQCPRNVTKLLKIRIVEGFQVETPHNTATLLKCSSLTPYFFLFHS